ncbi:hypothetical protein RKLH11_3379 [Rhodobacteraceae bacterium KLH11]|nr:hypothetical protein RKLH11_3379 [Rhodobacteraceae bacterium KLH11]
MAFNRSLIVVLSIFFAAFWTGQLTPSFQSPDEFDHIERAYLLSKGQFLLETPEGRASGGYVDSGLLEYMSYFKALPHQPDVKISSEELSSAKNIYWSGERIYETLPGTGYYFPLIYLPQAAALWVGKFLGQSVETSYKLTRLFTLSAGSLILLAAFRIAAPPAIVIALLFLPMTLFQAASASIDFLSTAIALLLMAQYISIMKENTNPSFWTLLGLSVLVFLLAGCRLHMAPLVLLPFTIGLRFRNAQAFSFSIILCLGIVLWYGFALSITRDMRVDLGAPTSQIIRFYLFNPLQFPNVLWSTLSDGHSSLYYLHSFLGILGWLDVYFTPLTYTALYLLVLISLILSMRQGRIDDKLISFAIISSTLSGIAIIFFSLLVTWTPHPASTIMGVQGRYFLLPALVLASLFEVNKSSERRARKSIIAENLLLALLFSFSFIILSITLEARYFLPNKI